MLCKAMITMAHELGLRVVAEGIETDAQRALLHEAGCDFGQGYFFGRPVPAEEFEQKHLRAVPRLRRPEPETPNQNWLFGVRM